MGYSTARMYIFMTLALEEIYVSLANLFGAHRWFRHCDRISKNKHTNEIKKLSCWCITDCRQINPPEILVCSKPHTSYRYAPPNSKDFYYFYFYLPTTFSPNCTLIL